jgi:hypothetical protein
MSWFTLPGKGSEGGCLVTTLRDLFHATPLRVPSELIAPLTVIAQHGEQRAERGQLDHILNQPLGPSFRDDAEREGQLAAISGQRSRSLKLELGLELLAGFLAGFGIPSAKLGAAFSGAEEVAFTFRRVKQVSLDIGVLGRALESRSISRNAATEIFFQENPWRLTVVDSVIQSPSFEIAVTKKREASFELSVPAIAEAVGEASAKVAVEAASKLAVTFSGPRALTFAYSAVRFFLDPSGVVHSLPPTVTFDSGPSEEVATPPRVLAPEGRLLVLDAI